MDGVISSLNSLAMIFLMIVPGIILSKREMISSKQIDGLNSIVVNVTWPCMVITGMQIECSTKILKDCVYSLIIITLVLATAFFLAKALVKLMRMKATHQYQFAFMLTFANTGIMGMPVINALYGKQALFYASTIEMINDVFLFTVGIMILQRSTGQENKISMKPILNPGFFGVIIGFMLFILSLKLPWFLGNTVNIIGAATTPLSMIIIGLQIGSQSIKELFGDWHMYVLSFAKLLIIPGIALIVIVFIMNDLTLLSRVLIMQSAMPVAAVTVVFSGMYKSDVAYATRGVMLSTLLSIATLPVFTVLLELIS